MPEPQDTAAKKMVLMKHLQHLVADVKGPESPQEVKPAQALLIDSLRVSGPVQFIVQYDTQVPVSSPHSSH